MRGSERVVVFSKKLSIKKGSFIFSIAHKMKWQELMMKIEFRRVVFKFLERKRFMHWNMLRFKCCRILKSAVTYIMFS